MRTKKLIYHAKVVWFGVKFIVGQPTQCIPMPMIGWVVTNVFSYNLYL